MSGKANKSPAKKKAASDGDKKKKKDKEKGSPSAAKDDGKAQQLQQLSAELVLAQGRLAALEAEQRAKDAELQQVRAKQEADSQNYGDVLRHQQLEQDALAQHARELELRLEAAQQQQRAVEEELRAAQAAARLAQEEEASSGMNRLLSSARRKDDVIAQQETELAQLRDKLCQANSSLFQAYDQIESLKYKASGRAQLLFLFDEPCLATVERRRLTGKLPSLQHPGQVLCCAGGRWLVQYGAVPAGEVLAASVRVLDMQSWQWAPAVEGPADEAPVGHAMVAAKHKLVTLGGSGSSYTPHIFSPSEMAWVQVPPTLAPSGPAPCPRTGAAVGYCSATNSLYCFGGVSMEGKQLLGDLWRLRLDTHEWAQLEGAVAAHTLGASSGKAGHEDSGLPKPCCNAALALSVDGQRLWLFGGSTQGGMCQASLWCYELPSGAWSRVEPNVDSVYVEPREGHVMGCVGRWLLAAGGACRQSTGEWRQLGDTLAFDTLTRNWDSIDANCWAEPQSRPGTSTPARASRSRGSICSSRPRGSISRGSICSSGAGTASGSAARGAEQGGEQGRLLPLGAGNCIFVGNKLLVLKPNPAGQAGELLIVELSLPDDTTKRRVQKRASMVVIENLELIDMAATPTSLNVAWMAPTKNAHKLVGFKLMVTGKDGSVREAYEGKDRSFELCGLTPDTEYILVVKAVYDDASFVWSESKALRTAAKQSKQSNEN